MTFSTGKGTPNRVEWDGEPTVVSASKFPHGTPLNTGTVVKMGGGSIPALETIAVFPAWVGDIHPGTWHAKAWIDSNWGLSLSEVRFNETVLGGSPRVHVLAEFLQWRNLRLRFKSGNAVTTKLLPIGTAKLQAVTVLSRGGTRLRDGKHFAWGIDAISTADVVDPRSSDVVYRATIRHTYLIASPAHDQDPAGAVLAIKVFPTLTISLQATYKGRPLRPVDDNWTWPAPDVAADLKMVHAPRLTRDRDASVFHDGQRRKDHQYVPLVVPSGTPGLKKDDIVVYAVNDSNDDRGDPGGMRPPDWNIMFDYINPWIKYEQAFDAVIYPRTPRTDPRPSFEVKWPPLSSDKLKCYREPGQGEYDNLHISPYVGFDDWSDPDPSGPATAIPLVEAPMAADEVFHMHWRWGPTNVRRAKNGGLSEKEFMGWSDGPLSRANKQPGAPMIAAHHSLRIKLAQAWPTTHADSAGDPATATIPLDSSKVAIWYAAIAHSPPLGTSTQFCGHGYSLAYYLKPMVTVVAAPLVPVVISLENWELLTPSYVLGVVRKPGYHDIRWTSLGRQQVPSVSDVPGIERNMLTPLDTSHTAWSIGTGWT